MSNPNPSPNPSSCEIHMFLMSNPKPSPIPNPNPNPRYVDVEFGTLIYTFAVCQSHRFTSAIPKGCYSEGLLFWKSTIQTASHPIPNLNTDPNPNPN